LFILDINRAPWGCAIWLACWTVGGGFNHLIFLVISQSNGQNSTNCDGTIPPNAGCGVQEWSRASYKEDFNLLEGGGVFVMKWDQNGIAISGYL
ncbi:hypothetical protein K435DRAFT_931326, partial [Dendrothele bispora CBS 962.96]